MLISGSAMQKEVYCFYTIPTPPLYFVQYSASTVSIEEAAKAGKF